MEFPEEQLLLLREMIRKGANKKEIMMQTMTPQQKKLFQYYSGGCDALALAKRLEESNVEIGINFNSLSGMKYIVENIKYFEALSEAIDTKINSGKQTLKRRKPSNSENER